MVTSHWHYSDSALVEKLQTGTLPERLFNHEGHLRLAWIFLTNHGVETAAKKVSDTIVSFVTFLEAKHIYHHTLTVASVYIVAHFKEKSKAAHFPTLLLDFPQLQSNFKGLIQQHYSEAVLSQIAAKKTFIHPDLIPFY